MATAETPRSPPSQYEKDFSSSLLLFFFFCPFSRRTCSRIPRHIINLTKSSPTAFSLDVLSLSYKNQASALAARCRVEVRGKLYVLYINTLYTAAVYIKERIVSDFYPKGFTDDVLCFFLLFLLPCPRKSG